MRISLHLGAHKTASTYLQGVLARNGDRLRDQGHACFGPDRLRHDLRLPALDPARPVQAAGFAPLGAALAQDAGAGRHPLLSEENLMGTTRPGSVAQGACLYPQAAPRIDRFLTAVQVSEVTLYLAVRSPLPFLVSAFGQRMMAGKLTDFDSYCAGVEPLALRWSDLVLRLVALPRVAQVIVWRHEDHADVLAQVLAHMLGPDVAGTLHLPRRATHAGPSARAIDEATAALQQQPAPEPRKAIRAAMKRWPKSAEFPGLMPFDAVTRARSDTEYVADIARIAALGGVTLLSPASAQVGATRE